MHACFSMRQVEFRNFCALHHLAKVVINCNLTLHMLAVLFVLESTHICLRTEGRVMIKRKKQAKVSEDIMHERERKKKRWQRN